MLQSSLFLFNQINQSQHESNFAIYRVTWGEEFFKAEWWWVAEEGLQHCEHILHEVVITMGCKFETLFGDMIRDWPRVKQNDKVYGREVYTRVAC